MISNNVDGSALSSAFLEKVNSDSRTFKARFLLGGSVLECDTISVRWHKGAGESVCPGSVFVPYLEATLANCNAELKGKDLTLEIGLVLADTSEEFLAVGNFTVSKTKNRANTCEITAVGYLNSKCSNIITIAAGSTISAAITQVETEIGVPIMLKGLTPAGSMSKGFQGICRDALSEIAALLGGFVTEDNVGRIVIAKYGFGEIIPVSGDRMTEFPEIDDADYIVRGLKVIVREKGVDEEGGEIPEVAFTSGTPNIEYRTENMTAELFSSVVRNVVGYSFRPARVALALGDPRLEPWDSVSYDDMEVPGVLLSFEYDGGLKTSIDASSAGEDEGTTIKGPITKALDQYSADLITAKDAILKRATIEQLDADTALIRSIQIGTGTANEFSVARLAFENGIAGKFTADQVSALMGAFNQVAAGSISAENMEAKLATFEQLCADIVSANQIKTVSAEFQKAIIGHLQTARLDAKYASINFANVDATAITQAWIRDLFVQGGFIAQEGTVFNLVGVHISGDLIDANTVRADRLLLQGENGLYYAINVNELGEPTASSDPKYQEGIDGAAIIAHSITADQITTQNIGGPGGWINFAAGTFAYTNAESGHGIVWDGDQLTISTDSIIIGEQDLSEALQTALNKAETAASTAEALNDYVATNDSIVNSLQDTVNGNPESGMIGLLQRWVELDNYMEFGTYIEDGVTHPILILGKRELNDFTARLRNDKIEFVNKDMVLAYLSGNALHVQQRISFGNYEMYQRNTGHFSIRYIGGGDG